MPRVLARRSAVVSGMTLAVCALSSLFAAPAVADRPTPGARYYGFPASGHVRADDLLYLTARLRVSSSGRRIAAVGLALGCEHRTSRYDFKSVRLKLSFSGRRGPKIRRDGSFALAGREDGRRYRLSGRFVTREYARLSFRARMLLPRPIDRRRYKTCRPEEGSSPTALYRRGIPPFSGCRSQHALTLLATDTGRVFQQYRLEGGEWFPHAYACLFATPERRVHLGQNYDDETLELPRMVGTLLAYAAGESALIGGFANVRIVDLSGDTPTRFVDATPGEPEGVNGVYDLVLKPNGAIAWMVGRGGYFPGSPYYHQLWALDAGGLRLLDTGADLALRSLELQDSTLTWTNAGSARTASLN